jgi:hypothetical protein
MATQGQGKNLRAFHAKIDATVFDAGDSRLRDAAQFGQLNLAKTLNLTNNANGLVLGPVSQDVRRKAERDAAPNAEDSQSEPKHTNTFGRVKYYR